MYENLLISRKFCNIRSWMEVQADNYSIMCFHTKQSQAVLGYNKLDITWILEILNWIFKAQQELVFRVLLSKIYLITGNPVKNNWCNLFSICWILISDYTNIEFKCKNTHGVIWNQYSAYWKQITPVIFLLDF